MLKGAVVRPTANFTTATVKARLQWNNIFCALKEKNCQPRILNPMKILLKTEGKTKLFSDEKLRKFTTSTPQRSKKNHDGIRKFSNNENENTVSNFTLYRWRHT